MIKLTPQRYIQGFCIVVLLLAVVREVSTALSGARNDVEDVKEVSPVGSAAGDTLSFTPHRIYSVVSYERCFPDDNELQMSSATALGIKPIETREELEELESRVVYISSNPYYIVEKAQSSVPYLVPRAAILLQDIGKTFFDSLQVKGIPLNKILVTSALRTREDVEKLQSHNYNATPNSCHLYATTFDIAYNRFVTVVPPDEQRRAVTNDTLKWVLSEVLNDMRQRERCFVKYEKNQGCFHVTVR